MAYQVLARKWRPQSFEQIRGQGHIARALSNAIGSGRIAHAYLFTGIRGVGKTSAARVLAKALNCVDGPTATPCNQCDSCREITDGKSSDVLEIDGASNTGVEDVRRLREAVRYPPVRGPYRVYIIDEVHMLSTAAFNALLKTLEEPPEHVIFVFATTDPHKIPVTILSRCQQFDFKRLSPRELGHLLGDVAAAEGVDADDRSLAALAREADGSVRDGQSLLDQVISYAGNVVRYQDVRDVLGVVDRELLLRVARAVVQRDPREVIVALEEAEQFGYDVGRFSLDLLDVFRDLAVLRGVPAAEDLVDLAAEEIEEVRDFCSEAGWEEMHALFDMLGRGVEQLRTASRPAVALEMTLLKMAKLPPLLSLAEIMNRAAESVDIGRVTPRPAIPHERPTPPAGASRLAQSQADQDPNARIRPAPLPPAAETPELPQEASSDPAFSDEMPSQAQESASAVVDMPSLWTELLAWCEQRNRPFWSVLSAHASLAAWNPSERLAEIRYDDPSHEFFLRGKQNLLVEFFSGRTAGPGPVQIQLSCVGKRCTPVPGGDESDRIRALKKEGFQHPLVRQAMDVFDGNVEEVKVLKP